MKDRLNVEALKGANDVVHHDINNARITVNQIDSNNFKDQASSKFAFSEQKVPDESPEPRYKHNDSDYYAE